MLHPCDQSDMVCAISQQMTSYCMANSCKFNGLEISNVRILKLIVTIKKVLDCRGFNFCQVRIRSDALTNLLGLIPINCG